MKVDAHHHFWKLSRGDYYWITTAEIPELSRDFGPEDLKPLIGECSIEKTILVQCAETVAETEFMLEIANASPFVSGVVGWVDLTSSKAPREIARLAQDPFLKALRPMLQTLPEDDWILRPDIEAGLSEMQTQGLRFDILIFPRHLKHVRPFIDNHPNLPMVIDHGAKPYIKDGLIDEWEAEIRAIARETPTFCKLSGLATEAATDWTDETLKPYVEVLIDAFGAERLMWGSDWPVLTIAGDYVGWHQTAQRLTAHLSEKDRTQIFGCTAANFYGIA